MATRDPERWGMPDLSSFIALGASPRATLGLLSAGRAMALLRGRRFVVPEDIHDVAPEVLRHRLLLSYDALAEGVSVEDVIQRVLQQVPEPRIAPHQDEAGRSRRARLRRCPWTTPAAVGLTDPWPCHREVPHPAPGRPRGAA